MFQRSRPDVPCMCKDVEIPKTTCWGVASGHHERVHARRTNLFSIRGDRKLSLIVEVELRWFEGRR